MTTTAFAWIRFLPPSLKAYPAQADNLSATYST